MCLRKRRTAIYGAKVYKIAMKRLGKRTIK